VSPSCADATVERIRRKMKVRSVRNVSIGINRWFVLLSCLVVLPGYYQGWSERNTDAGTGRQRKGVTDRQVCRSRRSRAGVEDDIDTCGETGNERSAQIKRIASGNLQEGPTGL